MPSLYHPAPYNQTSVVDKSPDTLAAFLESVGFAVKAFKSGDICYRLRSPWNPEEHTPSAYIYSSGVLKCYSTGKSGNIITFSKMFGKDASRSSSAWVPPPSKPKHPFKGVIPDYLLALTPEEAAQVKAYASSRCITRGYLCGATKFEDVRHLCVVFPHEKGGTVVGAKFRSITAKKDKMRLRGVPGAYVLTTPDPQFVVVIEGEANANSLWEYYLSIGVGAIVMSMGGVSNIPDKIPYNLPVKVLIDFDGDEAKYNNAMVAWSRVGTPVKLRLPKGEDVNSLYCQGKMGLIAHLLV